MSRLLEWQDRSACRGTSPDAFFVEVASPEVLAMCNGCAVQPQCAEYGMTQEFGIWGGLTEADRDVLRRQSVRPIKPFFNPNWHGTYTGYTKGCHKACCRAAKCAHETAARARRRSAALVAS